MIIFWSLFDLFITPSQKQAVLRPFGRPIPAHTVTQFTLTHFPKVLWLLLRIHEDHRMSGTS